MDAQPVPALGAPGVEVRVAPGIQVNARGLILRNNEVVTITDPEKLARWLRLGWVVKS